jgi:hypothetical protein
VSAGQPATAVAPSDPALDYFGALRESFDVAASAIGEVVERDLCLAGLELRLRCAGETVAGVLLPPFEHLAIEGADIPQLTIELYDRASSGVGPPPFPGAMPDAAPGTNPVARLDSGPVCMLAASGTGALTAADRIRGEAVFHLPDATRVPPPERAAPLREALQLLMAPRRRWLTHAGAVGRDGRGALLIGPGGSGKSTLALSCALAGMEIVADDYILLEAGPARAHAMQSTAKLTADSVARLGLSPGALDPAGFEPTLEGLPKALIDIRALAPGLMRSRLEVGALVAPAVSDISRPELRSISRPRALRRLAPSTVLQTGVRDSRLLAALVELVREVPAYELSLCPDPAANAAVVADLVDRLG